MTRESDVMQHLKTGPRSAKQIGAAMPDMTTHAVDQTLVRLMKKQLVEIAYCDCCGARVYRAINA